MADRAVPLRELLGARADPEFELSLPNGWERHDASHETQALLDQRMRRQLMRSGGVDAMQAYGALRGMLGQSMDDMRTHGVVALFAQSAVDASTPFPVPASIVARVRSAPSAEEMDGYVKQLIVDEGAAPLTGNRALLRVEREHVRSEGGAQLVLSSTVYVTPVPGTRRRRALELIAGYGRPTDIPRDDEQIELVHAVFDVMVASLRWKSGAA